MIIFDDEEGYVAEKLKDGTERRFPLETPEAFELMSRAWLRASWDVKYIYAFSWFGRPIIQLPEDMIRLQEVIWEHKPDVLIETGVAHGGSLVFYASLFKAIGKGRAIGVEIELRPHNRKAIDEHPLRDYIEIVDGSSIDPATVEKVRSMIKPGEKVMVMLDSNHTKPHVLEELRAYGPMVTPGCYIIAADGIMELVAGGPRTKPDWPVSNPKAAAIEFVKENPDFAIVEPEWPFNEGVVRERVTYWPSAFVKRLR
ncbi:cephalosporin hydroxylase family protein [Polymorphum gilvum]|uniref:Cephalosporin hydroxylase family protein n=1 Tax=Polymorphum gilvum (strain LMG 25793 / CGMCC 1.9160 / SL003B-26A1) TaxID=991905 RepID=F2IVH6_POLGS|nr:CmcI family methyltransferase [Polymorphum gilvum]ADZ72694.1 cephalosporin hydroxylase family protein [Polymorphum gilvum SL003B-26A1]